ncbi:pirin [Aquitalea magnusonii]|nr:pirin [Aquitalea magnusonii]
MPVIAPLQRMNHGGHFRAYTLRAEGNVLAPFLGVDHAWMSGPTFPPHRHAGFCAVSYVFLDSETSIDNRDSLGTHNLIRPGGLHWATAGSGIIHQEDPAEEGKTVHSLQIFVSLPPELEQTAPSALSLEPENIPMLRVLGSKIRVVLGSLSGVTSPLKPPTKVTLLDISLEDGAELDIPVPPGVNMFVMPIFGETNIDGKAFFLDGQGIPVYTGSEQPREVRLKAEHGPAKAVMFWGDPQYSTAN